MTVTEVQTYVTENPGAHFNDIVESVGITPDKLQRVSEQLEIEDTLAIVDLYGKTHYYPPGYDPWEQKLIALCRRETSREILLYLLENGSSSPSEVVDDVGIARGTLEWHVERLIDADVVTKERDSWAVELAVVDPEAVTRILQEIQPTLPERWLDRTSRLLDHLLEDAE